MEGLERFACHVAASLCKEPCYVVKYPVGCNSDNWSQHGAVIRRLNKELEIVGNLYAIFVCNGQSWEFRYVGKSRRESLKNRLVQHFITKPKGTSSKLCQVKEAVSAGKKVGFSYVDVGQGEELSVYVEAWIQNHRNPEWNKRKEASN